MRSETGVVRISGHMPTIRRNSIAVKSMEVMYSTVDLMSPREVVISVGWFSISEKESIPIDSRYRSFFWKPVSQLGGSVCFGHLHFITVALTKNFGLLQWKKGKEVGTLEWKGLQRPVKDLGMVGEGEREWCSVGNMGLWEKRVVAVAAEAIWV